MLHKELPFQINGILLLPFLCTVTTTSTMQELKAHKQEEALTATSQLSVTADQEHKNTHATEMDSEHLESEPSTDLRCWPKEVVAILEELKVEKNVQDWETRSRLLLIGETESGKTSLCKALAKAYGLPLFIYDATALAQDYEKSGEDNLIGILYEISEQKQPCLMVIDNIEKLNSDNEKHAEILLVVSSILKHEKTKEIVFIGISNNSAKILTKVDNYFKCIVQMPLPNESQRGEIIQQCMDADKKSSFNADATPKMLAQLTQGFDKQDLQAFVRLAAAEAHNRNKKSMIVAVTKKDCLDAIIHIKEAKGIPVSISEVLPSKGKMLAAGGLLAAAAYGYSRMSDESRGFLRLGFLKALPDLALHYLKNNFNVAGNSSQHDDSSDSDE